ncbi:MAG TPA: HTTM domain-containing protein [Candidatus Angelobacter sp.]|nr:HTTM domain-containing protein [Candidatus Angelobacter sp.]
MRRGKRPLSRQPANHGKEGPSSLAGGTWERFNLLLARPVSGASLAVVRICIGIVMVLEAYSLCRPSAMTSGQIPLETYYTGPDVRFNFPYEGFYWLPLLPPHWIYALVGLLALAGLTMALGFCYRISVATVFATWAYLFLVESTRTYWQSYYYLELLLIFLLLWMPAARRYSVDAWIGRNRNPPRTVPYWTSLLLRGQVLVMYFYGGVAKLNADWLLDAAPLRWNLQEPHVMANFEPYLTTAQLETVGSILHSSQLAYFLCYAGALFDLSIGFLLMARRTRAFALILTVIFHGTNHFIIYDNIDWLPLVGVATALIFLEPDWPERLWNWLRHPRMARPHWGWFTAGAIVFPFVGAALGWKSRANTSPVEPKGPHTPGRFTAAFVVVWLAWQGLMPLRHFLIAGDGRFTYEGLSFSWRLKADDHRALGVQIFVEDATIISRDGIGRVQINWNEWHGNKVIYRNVTPGRINWSQLPEILVLLEPVVGERIIYNPLAASATGRTETEARERMKGIWQELYDRQPKDVRRTVSLLQILDSTSAALKATGRSREAAELADLISRTKQLSQKESERGTARRIFHDVQEALNELQRGDNSGEVDSLLRSMPPFALGGESPGSAPFFLIDDPQLMEKSRHRPGRIDRGAWKNGPYTRDPRSRREIHVGGEPLIILTSNLGTDVKELMSQACIVDSEGNPDLPAYISWNSLKDLTVSKFNHISNQAFYLRRYARRVAGLWENEYGRRPSVHASTAVSLNGRPFQELVDPNADLASVPASWFRHNTWVRDLQMPRIPREALARH